ncbi:M56 family metallopeptidase [Streptococcus suis]|uniref:Regulatory protein BlaR1 n=2 Tax=Streptococcus suis TaxID=1307 RepID=A0A822VKP8_STRSU|nr:M56 family metallopeptidase [Streptococcus suis]AGZ23050.1 putative peptidase M56 [Streptococcus suis T15]MBO8084285.1 M56 family metallopeptidase [Streptococcus suis]MCB2942683.1 M56 family metallopeptidase [Streptococcus suis]MCB2951691.1 M56 family metallopeptidase [Streptococcus suis]MCB2966229.1 M56 family metallopeptidase [Streptococcus suis]
MIELVTVSALERSIKSIFIIAFILLVRRKLNVKSIKWANMILWSILFIYLIFPYSILVEIENPSRYGILQYILEPVLVIDEYIRAFVKDFGYLLSKVNRVFIAGLLLIYVITQIIQRNKAMKNSISVENDKRVIEALNLFKLKRKINILVNDKIKVPITYGVIRPKIILQSHILEDDELLKCVLIHELTHIKKFDIVFNHIKNLIACVYWYNIFILIASRYMEDDIEVLCDKLVIQRVGDTVNNRKEYCISMLKLIEQKEYTKRVVLKLHPTKERMVIMKKWKRTFSGVCAFALVTALSFTAFADVKAVEKEQVLSSEISSNVKLNDNNRVVEITDEEYNRLTLGEIPFNELRVADVDSKVTLDGLEHKSYKFNMESWTEPNHDGFTVKMSEMSCSGGLNYALIIKENGNEIYNSNFTKATTLTVKAYHNSRYEVIIQNRSTNSLKYRVKINSYIR